MACGPEGLCPGGNRRKIDPRDENTSSAQLSYAREKTMLESGLRHISEYFLKDLFSFEQFVPFPCSILKS